MRALAGLYIVTPDWDDTARLLEVTELALSGGASVVQYRHKTASPDLRRRQAHALLDLCRRHGKPLIINDHVDLCLALEADGIHVGGTDASVAQVRAAIGPDKIVGASCYGDFALAQRAQQEGASYVAFGGFYPSRVKQYAVTTSHDIVTKAKAEIALPNVVIGGMTVDHARPLVRAGAAMVAVISSIYLADNPRVAAQEFVRLFAE
ncbi:thiamine phosphate synthase [Undibacterium sp. Jales W-56]|uniref:thiamine phosphate synthase n=1 Tax=Undibacterium sp. Jales W-56 TaxID=2897325 RepID=UPI0021D292D4|nr:thiamine phosphate synthase [Undibacterium sp. Jales W-56]MCU6434785.1 thiamine phosphate synthase [Undibacterium sp. Jales W-56]